MKKIKIAIIGTGPSGFGAAETFRNPENRGKFEVTLYEKNEYVGGKCCTVLEDGSIANGNSGGYEVGATLLPKHSSAYKDLWGIIERYGIATSVFPENHRSISKYVRNNKVIPVNHLSWATLRYAPNRFFRAFRGFDEYGLEYVKYAHSIHAGFTGRPKALSKRLSRLYTSDVRLRMAGIMQGFGYADTDDTHLTPALLYYHQYFEPGVVESPIYKVDNGTQGIWATVASTYPKGAIKLGSEVTHVVRKPEGVHITTDKDTQIYDYLVVATPLKQTLSYMDYTKSDRQFVGKMKHNNYATVLCKVSGLDSLSTFNIQACMDKKHLGEVMCCYKRYPDSDYIAAYLYIKPGKHSDDDSIVRDVAKSIANNFGATLVDPEDAKVFHWPDYFGHLAPHDIRNGWYEKFETGFQGSQRTIYVSSGLHMETMGASVQYATREAKKYAKLWCAR